MRVLEFGERLDLVLWETCHIYATCQAYRAEADFQQRVARRLRNQHAIVGGKVMVFIIDHDLCARDFVKFRSSPILRRSQ